MDSERNWECDLQRIVQERISDGVDEQIVAVLVLRIPEKTGEVIQLTQQERISDRVVEQIVDVPVLKSGITSSKS